MPASESAPVARQARSSSVLGAIPARFASTRLPGKPLRLLAGRPLIEHVYRRAQEAAELDQIVVLTDDDRIAAAVAAFGGEVRMTPTDCASGTDRVAWAARDWQAEAIINIQGDEPLIDPRAIDRLAVHLRRHPEDPLVTLAAPAREEDRQNPEVVKVVVDLLGRALYFSRSPIPFQRRPERPSTLRHIGIYGYQRSALLRLAELPPSPLEQAESLEQLRSLENGVPIRVLQVERAWQGVDTMSDLERIEALLRTTADRSGSAEPR